MDIPAGLTARDRAAASRKQVRVVAGLDAVSTPENIDAVKGAAPALDPDISLDAALGGVICACLDHLVANWPALRCCNDVKACIKCASRFGACAPV
jgi:hypothetical protein